uniref:(northern house mosquito) hypothetical protein n=1 Tax=Culex pipiens TaxID=7175 RepID=A0A8D8DIH9_CULPI
MLHVLLQASERSALHRRHRREWQAGPVGEPLAERQPHDQNRAGERPAASGAACQRGHPRGRRGDVRLRRPVEGSPAAPPVAGVLEVLSEFCVAAPPYALKVFDFGVRRCNVPR